MLSLVQATSLKTTGKKRFIKADTVVIAVGYAPDKELDLQLNGRYIIGRQRTLCSLNQRGKTSLSTLKEVYTIGDYVEVRTALEAVHEGFEVGLKI